MPLSFQQNLEVMVKTSINQWIVSSGSDVKGARDYMGPPNEGNICNIYLVYKR